LLGHPAKAAIVIPNTTIFAGVRIILRKIRSNKKIKIFRETMATAIGISNCIEQTVSASIDFWMP
jgi:hypothetical protein